MQDLLLIHAAATFALFGLVWTVQLAIYPLFEQVGEAGFHAYHQRYTRRMGFVVAPLMVVELVTGIRLMSQVTPGASMAVEWSAFLLILLIWGTTAMVSVPLHNKLGAQFKASTARMLTATNWIRTGAWTLRAGLVGWMVWTEFMADAA
ncbi:hypothetical protein [Planctomycetes bacterium Pla163]|uniref:hypothetical protein n=1 Tax=Rohdeia mirabilis TaxID=2528008 RepID=UPI0011A222ED